MRGKKHTREAIDNSYAICPLPPALFPLFLTGTLISDGMEKGRMKDRDRPAAALQGLVGALCPLSCSSCSALVCVDVHVRVNGRVLLGLLLAAAAAGLLVLLLRVGEVWRGRWGPRVFPPF